MRNYDYIVQMRQPEFDRDCLTRKLFQVNMRLFHSSRQYREMIAHTCQYMEWVMRQRWEDYGSASDGGTHGISGANLGIPFNIIGYRSGGYRYVMINPVITARSEEMVETQSNCGSIKYSRKIPVRRHAWVDVDYYDPMGSKISRRFDRLSGGFTIQHEVDHNNGILISDRYLEQGGDPVLLRGLEDEQVGSLPEGKVTA